MYSKRSGYWESDCPISLEHKHSMWVIPKCCNVNIDLAARAPPMNKLLVIDDGLSVFAASDISVILSRMCSSLTCNCTKCFIMKNIFQRFCPRYWFCCDRYQSFILRNWKWKMKQPSRLSITFRVSLSSNNRSLN